MKKREKKKKHQKLYDFIHKLRMFLGKFAWKFKFVLLQKLPLGLLASEKNSPFYCCFALCREMTFSTSKKFEAFFDVEILNLTKPCQV